jgi:serine/threonine-protein kinase TNNI3K
MEAKLTDFGVSRERVAETMTAGVGTSLWMAPEVMMGEKYDAKADIFSLGVVLSELDTHCLPYARAKQTKSEAAVLQMVAGGKLRVAFSPRALKSMVDLGLACVSVDAKLRPTAAEALYKLHMILGHEV